MKRFTELFFILALAFSTIAAASEAMVAVPPSTITVTFTQENVPVDASFKKFTAMIDYEPAHPLDGRANFTIDIASFDLGSPEYNKEILKPEWFDAGHFPSATFQSTSLKATSPTQLIASGNLTIKGKTVPVTFPVTIKDDGKSRVYDGTLQIKRNDFAIGQGEWKDTDVLADQVTIKVHAVAAPLK